MFVMARHMLYRARYYLRVFQQVGYKFNEFWQWVKEHWHRDVVTTEHLLLNLIILVLYVGFSDYITQTAATIIITLITLFWFGPVGRLKPKKEKKPLVFTPRIYRLMIPFGVLAMLLPMTGIQLAWLRAFLHPDIYALSIGWALGDVLIPLMLFIGALIVYPVEKYIQRGFIKKAQKKLASMPNLKVVAITGSYGKTSTKFLIRDVLKERFQVCSTPGSYNTPMGITKVINNDLAEHHDILILEMGARYPGNIDELCDIAQPDISVVTNVGVAHLETFGSVENIAQTKSALVRRLPKGGTAILNADDPYVQRMAQRGDIEVISAGLNKGDLIAQNIRYSASGTEFTVIFPDGREQEVQLSLLGRHNVQNMLLAIGVGNRFGLRPATMAVAAKRVEPVPHRLELKKNGDITVIDDAFNSNPVGARNAVEILSEFDSGRRIIITPGMIELGDIQEKENYRFGESIGRARLEKIILVGPRQTAPIKKGILATQGHDENVSTVKSLFEANELIRDEMQPGDVILYENDLPDTYNEG